MKIFIKVFLGVFLPSLCFASHLGLPTDIHGGGTGLSSTPSAGQMLLGNSGGTAYALALMSGDATMAASGALTIATNAISNSKAAQMAAHTYKGNNTGSTANAADLTQTQLTAELNAFTSSLQGMVPSSGGGTTNFLRADGTWAAPSGGGGSTSALTKAYAITAHGFAVNDLVYCTAPTTCAKAKADADSTSEALGIVTVVTDANNFTFSQVGYVTTLTGLTANTTYYLSDATAGLLTSTEPTTVGHISKPMLFADSTTSGYVLNMRGQVITAAVAPATQYIFQGYHDNTCSWSTTSTSYVNPTDDGSCGFITQLNDGMGTVTSVGSKGPGLTIASAPRTGTLRVCATYVEGTPASNSFGVQMVDSSNANLSYAPTSYGLNAYGTGQVCAIQAVTASSAYSYKLQLKVSGGTGQIDSNGYNPAIMWEAWYLK